MSKPNLKKYVDDVTAILSSEEKKGQKEGKRKALQAVSPQIFVQSEQELLDMFAPMKKEQEGTLKSGEPMKVPPIISLSDKDILKVFNKVFDNYDTLKTFKQTGNEKIPLGDNGVYLTTDLYYAMITHAKKKYAKSGKFYLKPVKNLNVILSNITNPFGKAIADAEIAKRGGSRSDGSSKDKLKWAKERGYITSRITGHQSSKVYTKLPGQTGGYQEYRSEGLTDVEKSSGLQLGHGDAGIPTFMHKVLDLEDYLKNNDVPKEIEEELRELIVEMKTEYEPQLSYMENISLGKGMQKIYRFLIITGQSTLSNMLDNKQKEQKIGKKLKKKTIAFQEKHHNTVLKRTIGNLLIYKLVNKNKGVKLGNARWKPIRESKEKERVKGKPVNFKKKIRTTLIRQKAYNLSKVAAVGLKKQKSKERRKSSVPTTSVVGNPGSPMHLLAMFNTKLEQNIKDNMEGAALHNRTGRFAESVKVLNIGGHVKGTTGTIQYSYMRDPYGVFERDGMRDPRLLIDNTLREMAAEMALGKFTTQRV